MQMSVDSKQYLMCHRLREETRRVMAGADALPAPLPSVQGLGTGPCLTGETVGSASTQHCQLLLHSFIQHRQQSARWWRCRDCIRHFMDFTPTLEWNHWHSTTYRQFRAADQPTRHVFGLLWLQSFTGIWVHMHLLKYDTQQVCLNDS